MIPEQGLQNSSFFCFDLITSNTFVGVQSVSPKQGLDDILLCVVPFLFILPILFAFTACLQRRINLKCGVAFPTNARKLEKIHYWNSQ